MRAVNHVLSGIVFIVVVSKSENMTIPVIIDVHIGAKS